MRFVAVIVCACALVPATVPSASAQTADAARLDALQRQLAQQQAELQRLRQQVDSQQATIERLPPTVEPISLQTGGTAKDSAVAKAAEPKKGDDGWIDLSSEKWTIKLGGHVQTDYVMWADHSPTIPAQNYFEFRRLRLVADGTGYGVFDFRLQMTLEPETVGESGGAATSPDVKDAYLSMNEIPFIGRARIGNFFVPFGLEQVTNDTNNIFLERSIPTQGVFTADREVGVAFYNCTEDQNLSWSCGAFIDSISDTIKERIDDNQGLRLSSRVVWLPYYDEPSKGRYLIHTGAGVLYTDDQDNSIRFRTRPQIHEGPRLIDSGALLGSTYTTGNLELAGVYGPFTAQSEAYVSSVNLSNGDQKTFNGAYVHFSYFLTGENRIYERFGQHGAQFGRNVPFTNFFLVPGGKGWGAWEAKTRISYLDLDEVDRGRYNDVTAGVNWYWTERIRVMFDWIHPITTAETTYGETESDILGMRFDFNW
ncbi:MAG: porin [Planctomycetia bacterium]|nr:porin [Planctomycetia bacterium]